VFVAIDGSQFLSRLSRTYLVRRRHAVNELVTITSPNRVVSSLDSVQQVLIPILAVVLLVVAVIITVIVTRILVRPLKRASKQILAAAKLDVAGDTHSVAGLHVRELDDMSEGAVRGTCYSVTHQRSTC